MKLQHLFRSTAIAATFFSAACLLSSCDDERLTLQDSQDIAEDALTDAYFEDADDLSSVALLAPTEEELGGQSQAGRITQAIQIEVTDSRACVGDNGKIIVTVEPTPNSNFENPVGVLTVDFGAGCTDIRGNVRSGKLIFNYSGRRFAPNSTVVLTTDNYFINGIKLEGTRTHTNITGSNTEAPKFSIVLVDGKATFPDGTIALREADFTRKWVRAASPSQDTWEIEGGANGTTRSGRPYTMSIEETIVFKRSCASAIPASGVKIFTVDSKIITIDYGNGDCDRSITYSVGDRLFTFNVGNN
jgi:hypothetical protein